MNINVRTTLTTSRRSRAGRRCGVTLLETVVTLGLVGVVLSTIAPVTRWSHAQRRASDRRELAIQTAANQLERFSARGWDEITQAAADQVVLPAEAASRLPEASLTISVDPVESATPAKRITVAIAWTNRAGRRVPPATLTAYVFAPGGAP